MSWRNETVPGDPTIRGFLHYLPIGESGVLVQFGGERLTANKFNSASTLVLLLCVIHCGLSANVIDVHQNDISEIQVYDIATGKWYTQKATGNPFPPSGSRDEILPEDRVLGCSVVMTAPDNSSYNIYMLGGQTQSISLPGYRLNDMWVLSIPSFNWIKVWYGKLFLHLRLRKYSTFL